MMQIVAPNSSAPDLHDSGNSAVRGAGLVGAWLAFASIMVVAALVNDAVHFAVVLIPNALLVVSGTIIVGRTRQRSIGWILIYLGLVFAFSVGLALEISSQHPVFRAILGAASGAATLLAYLVLIFPVGQPPNTLGRWLKWPILAYFFATTAYQSVSAVANPSIPPEDLGVPGEWVFAILGILVLTSQVIAYRHRTEVEKNQIKWLLSAGVVAIVGYPIAIALWGAGVNTTFLVIDAVLTSLWPLAILVAITRYKLYDINRLISRTLSYALVVGLLAVLFFGVVAAITALLPTQNSLAVAASTLAVAAVFNPLRRRVQALIDRRFNRSRYEAAIVFEQFTSSLHQEGDTSQLMERLTRVVGEVMDPAAIGSWARDAGAPSQRRAPGRSRNVSGTMGGYKRKRW